jgi:anthranilate phosphoribosyltransferase
MTAGSWPAVLSPLAEGTPLRPGLAGWALSEVFAGRASGAQIGAFAFGMAVRGVTAAELAELAGSMLAAATPITVTGRTLDIVGTGGDAAATVNISTMASVVAAAAGAKVVKHGSRAASSQSGAADVLEASGAVLDLPAPRIADIADRLGFTFCLAAAFHPAMRFVAGPRRELGIRTIFNFLGPLANPARPSATMLGCADVALAPVMAEVLAGRGTDALVVHGDDGLDELTTTGPSRIWVVRGGQVREQSFDPAVLGIAPADPAALRGGTPADNAAVFGRVLAGEPGPVRDIVLLNAAAGLAVHDVTPGSEPGTVDLAEVIGTGLVRARTALDSGAAADLFSAWLTATVAAAAA